MTDFVIGTGTDGIIRAREAADWLDKEMPNPPTDQAQRWDLYSDGARVCIMGIQLANSTLLLLGTRNLRSYA